MTITTQQAEQLTGKVYSQDSNKIGSIGQVYLDDQSGEPTWVTAKTGLFGSSESFVPLEGARVDGDDVYVAFDEDMVKNAPRIDPDGDLSPQEETELYRYYGLDDSTSGVADRGNDTTTRGNEDDSAQLAAPVATGQATDVEDASYQQTAGNETSDGRDQVNEPQYANDDVPADAGDASEAGDDRRDLSDATVGQDRSGPTTDDAMTRSEERLNVGTRTQESGRARLRKFVTTETVTQTVPVSHEEVTLEREPITDENRGAAESGAEISEEEHEVVLHEEVPVVEKEVVGVERVKLGTETKTEDAEVSEDVRKENIEMVHPDDVDRTDR